MILQALCKYYERKSEYDANSIAPEGFEYKEIPYIIVLDIEGNVINIESTYEGEGKSKRARKFLVPQSVKRASGIKANLLWDNPEYALGVKIKSKAKRLQEMHAAFIKRIDDLENTHDKGLNALKLFLKKNNKEELLKTKFRQCFEEMLEDKKALVTFRLSREIDIISQTPDIINSIKSLKRPANLNESICLISAEKDNIADLHAAIKGVWGAQSAGGNIVSFNLPSFCSYNKEQGYNAPCSNRAVFAYTTALNSLLDKDSVQRMQVGDASTVFWAEKPNDFENNFASFFKMPTSDNPDNGTNAVKALMNSVHSGTLNTYNNDKTEFYVLGLSPNAARISVRFFIKGTVAEMSQNIARYFEDLKIDKPSFEDEFLYLFKLLVSTAAFGRSENIAPHLAGDFMTAILHGLPYPRTLLQSIIIRIKAEQKINYSRAALIKAYLKRNEKEDIKVSLNKENINQGYLLGRLFAALEKLQEEAQGDINSTIMRYYSSASSTPIVAFANLMRLHHHHLNKLGKEKPGRETAFSKLIGEIKDKLDNKTGYPAHLPLAQQGMFAIGYYQQRQDFFKTKEEKEIRKQGE